MKDKSVVGMHSHSILRFFLVVWDVEKHWSLKKHIDCKLYVRKGCSIAHLMARGRPSDGLFSPCTRLGSAENEDL